MERRDDLNRWVERGLISAEQRDAILEFERGAARPPADSGPSRLASAVSTVGAAVAIAAVAGIIALFEQDWSSAEGMVAAAIGAVVMIAAAWMLAGNGWGAPAGLCALFGLVLIPLALGFGADAAGWWPEESATRTYEEAEREQQRVIGFVLLLSILPAIGVGLLDLRQAWATLPLAAWYGTTLLFTNVFENIPLTLTQALVGPLVAGLAVFVWRPDETGRGVAWWLQLGGLALAAQAIAISPFEERAGYALLAIGAAAVLFVIGVVRERTAWIVSGALPAIVPAGWLVFEYFEGLTGLLIVAVAGMLLAFVPLLLRRRGQLRSLG